MKKNKLLLFVLFASLIGYGQKKFSAEILTGFGFNEDITLVNQTVDDLTVYSTQINGAYKFELYKAFSAETGLGAQWYFSSGNIELSRFDAIELRINVPFIITYPLLKNISFGAGVNISNNRDFSDTNFRENNNLRTSLVLKGYYTLNEDFSVLLALKQNLSDTPDVLLVSQPNTDIALGISYKLF